MGSTGLLRSLFGSSRFGFSRSGKSCTTADGRPPTIMQGPRSSDICAGDGMGDAGPTDQNATSAGGIHLWKTDLCRFGATRCLNGQNFCFAHGGAELNDKPNLARTYICRAWQHHKCARETWHTATPGVSLCNRREATQRYPGWTQIGGTVKVPQPANAPKRPPARYPRARTFAPPLTTDSMSGKDATLAKAFLMARLRRVFGEHHDLAPTGHRWDCRVATG